MSDYQIFSDGSCDMPRDIASQYNIKIIPFYVSLDSETYLKEIDELSLESFYKKIINEKIYPKTSLPSAQDYINAFTPALEEGKDILCYTITDTLSGSYQSASTAKLMLLETYPNAKIFIVNSWLATGAQYLLVIEAAKMQKAGYPIEKVYELSEKLKKDSRIIFMVGSLDYLQKGGRIGKLAALSGKILNIKPLIILQNGEINTAGVARSRKKGIQKLIDLTKEYFEKSEEKTEQYHFMVGTTNTWEEAEIFEADLKNTLSNIKFEKTFQIGATISSHTGPDTIGLCFIKDYSFIK